MDTLFVHRAVARSTKKIVLPSSAYSALQSLHSVFSVPFRFLPSVPFRCKKFHRIGLFPFAGDFFKKSAHKACIFKKGKVL